MIMRFCFCIIATALISTASYAQNVGTSGAVSCLLNSTLCSYSGEQSLTAAEDHAISTITASFTYDATMHNVVAGSRSTALTAAVTATLPACVAATKGRTYGLKKVDTSSNAVTLTPNGSDTIDGAANLALSAQFAQANVQCDGAGNWWRGFY